MVLTTSASDTTSVPATKSEAVKVLDTIASVTESAGKVKAPTTVNPLLAVIKPCVANAPVAAVVVAKPLTTKSPVNVPPAKSK